MIRSLSPLTGALLLATGCIPVAVLPVPDWTSGKPLRLKADDDVKRGDVSGDGWLVIGCGDQSIPNKVDADLVPLKNSTAYLPTRWRTRVWVLQWFVWGKPDSWIVPELSEYNRTVAVVVVFVPGYYLPTHGGSLHEFGSECGIHDPLQISARDPEKAIEAWESAFSRLCTRECDDRPCLPPAYALELKPPDYRHVKEFVEQELRRLRRMAIAQSGPAESAGTR